MEVKGTALIAIRDYVKKDFTSDYNRWLDSLSPDAQKIYGGAIDSTKWYPVEEGAKDPTEKIAKLFFRGNNEQGAKESGRYSAERALTGIYKIFVKAANPQYIIKRASRVFSTYYRPCEMKVVRQSDNGVVSEISELNSDYNTVVNRIIGWCEKALEISGCQNVNITATVIREEPNGKVVELDKKWD